MNGDNTKMSEDVKELLLRFNETPEFFERNALEYNYFIRIADYIQLEVMKNIKLDEIKVELEALYKKQF